MRPILISTAALALAGLGCRGGDDKAASSSSATTTPQAAAPPPAELLGTYTTTLKRSDLPDPAPRTSRFLESSAMAVTGD